jgi:hypothetical protein
MLTGSGQFDKSDGTGVGLWDGGPLASLGRSANSRLLSLSSADRLSTPNMIELAASHHARRCLGMCFAWDGSVCRSHLSDRLYSSSNHSGSSQRSSA